MNKNGKYFLNLNHATRASFQSSGCITKDIRFGARLAPRPNFLRYATEKLLLSAKRYTQSTAEELKEDKNEVSFKVFMLDMYEECVARYKNI